MTVFERAGRVNTERTLEIAVNALKTRGISELVVASTYGTTALKAVELIDTSKVKLIVITHNFGFKEPASLEMDEDTRSRLIEKGAIVYTGTMPFRNIGTAIRSTLGYSQQDLIANTLRLFCQGVKVCVELALMASDAGFIGTDDIIAVAGTGRGADTCAIIKPASSNALFDLKVREILVKPFDW